MNLNEFNEYPVNGLLDRLSKLNNTVPLLEDFNINLRNYGQDKSTNEFLYSLSSHLYTSTQYTWTSKSENWLRNFNKQYIFKCNISQYYICQSHIIYLASLVQFLTAPNIFPTPQVKNVTHMRETGLNLNKEISSLTTFQLIGIILYIEIVMRLKNPMKNIFINLTLSWIYMHAIKNF